MRWGIHIDNVLSWSGIRIVAVVEWRLCVLSWGDALITVSVATYTTHVTALTRLTPRGPARFGYTVNDHRDLPI